MEGKCAPWGGKCHPAIPSQRCPRALAPGSPPCHRGAAGGSASGVDKCWALLPSAKPSSTLSSTLRSVGAEVQASPGIWGGLEASSSVENRVKRGTAIGRGTHAAPRLADLPGLRAIASLAGSALLPGNKEGKGSHEEDAFVLPHSYITPQECGLQRGGSGGAVARLGMAEAAVGCRGTRSAVMRRY